ncbi:hypothetical protein OROHE_009991 [Orobanche hederae]
MALSQAQSRTLVQITLRAHSPTVYLLISQTYRNLGHNFLTGPLDDVLHGLENLKLMDLSSNSFTGELPTSFGSLTNLTGFNQFTGSVIFLANLSLFTGVDFTLMSVHDSPHMSAFSSSPMIAPSLLPPFRAKTLKVSRRKSFSKSKTIIGAKAYTVAELQIATNNFSEENLIGEGSLGSVYRAEFPDGTGLSLSTDDRSLEEAFNKYGAVVDEKNGGVSLREEDVMVNNVRPDLTCGRHSLLGRVRFD